MLLLEAPLLFQQVFVVLLSHKIKDLGAALDDVVDQTCLRYEVRFGLHAWRSVLDTELRRLVVHERNEDARRYHSQEMGVKGLSDHVVHPCQLINYFSFVLDHQEGDAQRFRLTELILK